MLSPLRDHVPRLVPHWVVRIASGQPTWMIVQTGQFSFHCAHQAQHGRPAPRRMPRTEQTLLP